MAKLVTTTCVILTLFIFLLTISNTIDARKLPAEKSWFRQVQENTIEIRFYLHDFLSGPNASVYEVARSSITATSPTEFGQVRVFDDLLTSKIDHDSEVVGRAQGIISSADFKTYGYSESLSFVFTSGEYNGSTISVMGRNPIYEVTREMAVVGGTGMFRMARGYCITRTVFQNPAIDYLILEFTLYFTYPMSIQSI